MSAFDLKDVHPPTECPPPSVGFLYKLLVCVVVYFSSTDIVIPESPEAYIKLTENTLKSSSGRL